MFIYSSLEYIISVFQNSAEPIQLNTFPDMNCFRLRNHPGFLISTCALFQLPSGKRVIIKLPLCSICCYANTTDFMIIATKTRIRVMYATKSSKSNSFSSGLGAVEFMADHNHKLCILDFQVQSSPFQSYEVLLECFPVESISVWISMLNCRINKAWLSDPLRAEFVPFSLRDGNANWVRYRVLSSVITVIRKDISCSVFEVRRSLKTVTSQMA